MIHIKKKNYLTKRKVYIYINILKEYILIDDNFPSFFGREYGINVPLLKRKLINNEKCEKQKTEQLEIN